MRQEGSDDGLLRASFLGCEAALLRTCHRVLHLHALGAAEGAHVVEEARAVAHDRGLCVELIDGDGASRGDDHLQRLVLPGSSDEGRKRTW